MHFLRGRFIVSLSAFQALGLTQKDEISIPLPDLEARVLFSKEPFLSKGDVVEVEGEVTETLPSAQFRVHLDTGQEVIGHLSGKMRMHRIRVLPGDRVRVAFSPYDLTKGRIVSRLE